MSDDELLAQLRAADPARGIDPADSWIDDLVEATVSAAEQQSEQPTTRKRWLVPGAAAAAVVAIGLGGFALTLGDDDGDDGGDDAAAPTVVALSMPAGDSMQMCMEFSADALRPMEQAFAGTASTVSGDQVTLEVDEWFKGGDADLVELTSPTDVGVLLEAGVEFVEGERYLVTATDGTVNACGFSGPWTQEMADAFEAAF